MGHEAQTLNLTSAIPYPVSRVRRFVGPSKVHTPSLGSQIVRGDK